MRETERGSARHSENTGTCMETCEGTYRLVRSRHMADAGKGRRVLQCGLWAARWLCDEGVFVLAFR